MALRLEVESWRWGGVPFFIRAGKAMDAKVTEVRIIFNEPAPDRDRRRGEAEGRRADRADRPRRRGLPSGRGEAAGRGGPAPGSALDLLFEEELGDQPGPYERLLLDALAGDPQRFSREDMVEECWRIVQPLIDKPCELEVYEPGGWGPESASNLTHGYGGWRKPWLPADRSRA